MIRKNNTDVRLQADVKKQDRAKAPAGRKETEVSYFAGLPVVLKFLKFHSCPEIVLKTAVVLKFYSFCQNVLISTFVMLSLHFLQVKTTFMLLTLSVQ